LPGNYVNSGACEGCASTVKSCVSSCLSLGFYTQNTVVGNTTSSACNSCGSNAASCVSNTVATSCGAGYYLSTAAVCVACGTNGVKCDLK